jgi:hypothetical protein
MSAQTGSQRSIMTLNGQVYHVLHDDKHIKALTKVGLINTSTPASQAMQEVYAAWLLPQESKFEGDKGRNLCIADQYSADRWLLYPLHVYAALAKGAPVENDRLDDFFFQKIIQGQFLPITPSTRSVLITTEPQKGTTLTPNEKAAFPNSYLGKS